MSDDTSVTDETETADAAETESVASETTDEATTPEPVETDTVDIETEATESEPTESEATAQDAIESDATQSDAAEQDSTGQDSTERPARSSRSADLLEREGEVAADFLESLLDICDIDGDIDVDVDGDRATVSIVDSDEGRVPRRLVGTDGKVLDALQELTRLAVYTATGERSRLMLDIAGHREARREALVEQAKVAIEAVRESGERQELSPMTAFERKVVHDEVLAAGLRSESEGAEPRRFVVVLPAG